MKYLINIFFFLILCISLNGQGYQIITTVDTLQSGDVIITQTDINGNIIDKGLAKPGFVFENDTSELIFTPPSPPDNTGDVFVDNIDMPGVDGGFLPQDIVFNPHNGNYYIYGYRRVLVCDVDMNVIKTLEISNLDNFLGFYSDYHRQMICVHPTENKVYCLTLEGALVEIDQYYNVNELTPSVSDVFIERGSMFCLIDGNNTNVWFYLQVLDENEDQNTLLYKYSTAAGGTLNSLELEDEISYDLAYISLPTNYKVYLSTHDGIEVFTHELTQQTPISPSFAFDHILVLNNLLFAHRQGEEKLRVFQASGVEQPYFYTINYADIRFILTDNSSSKLYLSEYDETSAGVEMIEEVGSSAVAQTIVSGYDAIFGLAQNSSYVIACGKADVIYINKTDESYAIQNCSAKGPIYRIATSTVLDQKSCGIQPLNGNAIAFAPAQSAVLDIGGQVSALCVKGDKVFAAVHKYNQDGYILVLNASSGMIIDKIQPNFDFNPVDIFCANDPEIDNDRVYVVYVDMDDVTAISRLCYFDCNTYQVTQPTTPVQFAGGQLEYLITPNGTIGFGVKIDDFCPAGASIYFYDFDLNIKEEPCFFTQACITEFKYFTFQSDDQIFNYFVWVSRCNHTIYCFEDGLNGIPLKASVINTDMHDPQSLAYNESDELCYLFDQDEKLFTIDPTDFSCYYHSGFTLTDEGVKEMFYNGGDNSIYVITTQSIIKIRDPDSPIVKFDLPYDYITHHVFHRDDDFIFCKETDTVYLPSILTEDFSQQNILMIFNFTADVSVCARSQKMSINDQKPNNIYQGIGKHLAYHNEKKNLYEANIQFSNTSLLTTHSDSRHLTGNWDWISFPCMPRLGNEGYGSQDLLEELDPLPSQIQLITMEGFTMHQLTYNNFEWFIEDLPTLISTQGYKYNSNSPLPQDLEVNGVVLDPSTSIQLSSQYENWIGYFLEYSLSPDDAFIGVWDKLTRISTKDWTIILDNGTVIKRTYNETPLSYGDGLIVEVAEDCELVWNTEAQAEDDFELPQTENISFNEQAEYTPFYFEMDSMYGVREIGLTVNDSCVGAAVVEPGDSIVEVNAYLAGAPSGVPIEVETWDGYKSAGIGSENYSVVNPYTKKRISRKVYTGEGQPYYIISFKAGETTGDGPLAMLQPPSPNPFSNSTMLSFVLNQQANISLTVHNLRGNRVSILKQGNCPEGLYEAGWAGTDGSGNKVENGIYIIRLTVDDRIIVNEKVVLIR